MVELARQHGLVVLSDEIYDKILYDGAEHVSTAALAPDLLCLTFNGLSKAYRLAGFRSGWMVLSGPTQHARGYIDGLDILANMRLCPKVPSQHAIATALGGHRSIDDLTGPGGRLLAQRDRTWQLLNELPGVSCVKPAGAPVLLPPPRPSRPPRPRRPTARAGPAAARTHPARAGHRFQLATPRPPAHRHPPPRPGPPARHPADRRLPPAPQEPSLTGSAGVHTTSVTDQPGRGDSTQPDLLKRSAHSWSTARTPTYADVRRFSQVDGFTTTRYRGNPVAVVLEADVSAIV